MTRKETTISHHLACCREAERITVAISSCVSGVKTVIYFPEISEQQNLTTGNH